MLIAGPWINALHATAADLPLVVCDKGNGKICVLDHLDNVNIRYFFSCTEKVQNIFCFKYRRCSMNI